MVSALFRSQRFLSRLGLLSLAAMFLNFYETFQMWQLSLWFPLPSHQICTVQLTVVEYLPATLSCFVFIIIIVQFTEQIVIIKSPKLDDSGGIKMLN